MAVDRQLSRDLISMEMEAAYALASIYRWIISFNLEALIVRVRMVAHNGDRYIVELALDDYRELPPAIEFIDPLTGEVGTGHCFPKGHDSFFNSTGPTICAPINRNAYKRPNQRHGIHNDWAIGDWANSNVQGFPWAEHATIAGILCLIQNRLDRPQYYHGRMAS
jgi:hypothetical protein